MPECSEMEETECNTNSNCNWTEDIDYASCSSLCVTNVLIQMVVIGNGYV